MKSVLRILLFMWSAFPGLLLSQTVEWSNQQKLKSRNNYSMILGENPSGYFVLRSKDNDFNKELILEKYRSNLAVETSREMWQPPVSSVSKILLQATGLIAIGAARNNTIDKIDLFAWRFDDDLVTDQKIMPLFQVDEELIKSKDDFYIRQSADKSKILVMYLTYADNKQKADLNMRCYAQDLTLISSKVIRLESSPDDVFITAFDCNSDGDAFVLLDYPVPGVEKKRGSSSRQFMVYGVYQEQTDPVFYVLNNDSIEISDLGMVLNGYNHSITVTGFYHPAGSQLEAEGMFLASFDTETTLLKRKHFTRFEKSFLNRTTTAISNENSPGLNDLAIRKIIPRSDGGCIVLAEKFYETKQTYTYYVNGFPQSSSRTIYNFDEILVFSLSADGKMQFNEIIKKRQSSINDGGYYSSFVPLNTTSAIALIYSVDASAEGDVMISTITPKGELDTKILIKAMSYYVSLMPPESKQVSANSALICALKDRKFCLMKVTY